MTNGTPVIIHGRIYLVEDTGNLYPHNTNNGFTYLSYKEVTPPVNNNEILDTITCTLVTVGTFCMLFIMWYILSRE